MNAITKVAGSVRPTAPGKPSGRLTLAMNSIEPGMDFCKYLDGHHYVQRMPPADVIEEAKVLAVAFEQALAPVGADVVQDWLRPVAAAVTNPPTRNDFAARAAAVAMVCADLPICVFTPETQRDAIIKFKFWPSASEVHELLNGIAWSIYNRRDDVLKVVRARPLAEYDAACKAMIAKRDAGRGTGYWPSDHRRSGVSGGF